MCRSSHMRCRCHTARTWLLRTTLASLVICRKHLVRKVLVVDEHPVVTCFWTFREGVDRARTIVVVRTSLVVLQLTSKNPRPPNQRRLRVVRGFLSDPISVQYVRRTSLCLQLIGLTKSVAGQTAKERHELPLAARLSRGENDELVESRLRWLLVRLHYDPWMNAVAAWAALLAIAFDVHPFSRSAKVTLALCGS